VRAEQDGPLCWPTLDRPEKAMLAVHKLTERSPETAGIIT